MSKRTVVEWSPHDASLFAVGADNLRLFEVTTSSGDYADADSASSSAAPSTQRKRAFRVVRINAKVQQLRSLQWHPFEAKPLLIATGTGSGKVLLCDFEDPRARVMREFLPKYSRPCHAVAWNPSVPHQLAAGFEKVRSDFCTLVWDLNSSGAVGASAGAGAGLTSSGSSGNVEALGDQDGSRKGSGGAGSASVGVGAGSGFAAADAKPVHELANSEATMALSWVPLQPTCLATGTGFKWLRVYDLRAKGSSPMSVVAHNKAVLGVVFDQHRPHMLATYSDAPQEPVKVWDIRQLESSSGPLLSLYQTSKNLAQVSWCPSKPGILVTASTEEKWVSLWDVTKQESGSSTLKKPFRRRYTSEPLTSFSWQHVDSPSRNQRANNVGKSSNAQKCQLSAAAFPNRLLTASITGELGDISVHDAMPLSLSSHGAVTFGCGRLLFGGSVSGPGLGTSAVTRLTLEEEISSGARVEEDISNEMYKLAKQGYSIGLSKNLKLFNEATPRGRQLHHLWLWVDQVEALRRIRASRVEQSRSASNGLGNNAVNSMMTGPLRGWPVDPNTLVIAGVKNLLTVSGETPAAAKTGTSGSTATVQEDSREEEPVGIVSVMKTDQVLGCQYFEGPGRRLGLLACNWDPDNGQGGSRASSAGVGGPGLDSASGRNMHRSSSSIWNPQKQYDDNAHFANRSWNENGRHELQNILNRCELEGNYARAAALAVFHGDLNAAVALLQKGATWLTQMQHLNVGVASPYSPDLLQLIAMSVAGYSSSIATAGGLSLWSNMTQQLLKRSEIMSQANPRYFHAMLSFLCAASSNSSSNSANLNAMRASQQPSRRPTSRRQWGSVDGLAAFGGARPASAGVYSAILNDITLPLSDRLAFACRYLQAEDLLAFVAQHEEESEQFGRLEGLIVTGINADGIRLLQTYLDMTGDIQTLALLAARLPSSYVAKASPLEKWIQIYKDLLNQWQLFHERARFDVGRSQLEDLLNGFTSFSRDFNAEDLQAELSAPSTLSVPPQLFVRCNFCNASLSLASLLRLGGSHSSWLNRAKPKLTCCPTCRKPLPQCALCLLPFGSLNPYFELAHRRSRQTSDAVNTLVSSVAADSGGVLKEPKTGKNEYENLAQLSSIPFVEWFTWCQSCKHGGHAHHLADWFKSHSVCPVTDCNCHCQHLDLPIVGDENQTEIIEHQRASAAALASQRAASKGKKKQQQQQQQYQQQKQQEAKAPVRGVKKSFLDKQQQQVSMGSQSSQHSFSVSSTMGTNSTYRSFSSAQLRPSGSTSGYPPPFSLSGSNSVANLSSVVTSGAGGNVGSGAVSDGISLGNKLDQLEKDKNSYQYM
ncbi:WD repeat-containing protein mio [Phytophthora cinnamomi]|uniref:WD repeat-containing protein mio n=1 Tax=Phytophthora cinnamomi TaxID=4785 RepID=UPI00355A32D5|nr:WD repeat-containing protein mio [Phytophthora cinnamomi]